MALYCQRVLWGKISPRATQSDYIKNTTQVRVLLVLDMLSHYALSYKLDFRCVFSVIGYASYSIKKETCRKSKLLDNAQKV
jgi:hypothetical protein